MDYYLPNNEQHYPPSSLHDMIDVEMSSSDTDMFPQHSPSAKITSSAQLLNQINQESYHCAANSMYSHGQMMQNKYNTFPPTKMEINGAVPHLSWLNSITTNQPHLELTNPSLVSNTTSPNHSQSVHDSNGMLAKTLSLPNSVQISGGNVSYVSMPSATQQVYINTMSKPSVHQPTGFVPVEPQQQNGGGSSFMMSPTNGIVTSTSSVVDNPFPKPAYSYSCLIAMALKNSKHGSLPVAEIYNFMMRHFPYFKTAPDGWKNSVRHNLSLNKCFEKIENPNSDGTNSRKGCLWALNPAKMRKMDEEILKWNKKDPSAIKRAMAHPEVLEMLEKGHEAYIKLPNGTNNHLSSPVRLQNAGLLLPVSSHQQQQRHSMQQQMKMSPPPGHQNSPPPPMGSGMSPLMTVSTHHGHQMMETTMPITSQAPSNLQQEANQLYDNGTDLALDPALSEINIQVGASSCKDDEYCYMFGPQAQSSFHSLS